ncbi:MAG: hypothetical protein ACE5JL_16560 [Dehalococcoidia bacterium]
MKPTVMLVGLGDLGNHVLQLLACQEWVGPIVAATRDRQRGEAYCNLALLNAMAQGRTPAVRFESLDLDHHESAAETIHRVAPDMILHMATLQSWWLASLLPSPQAERIRQAGFGVWLPVHQALSLQLAQILSEIGYRGLTLMAPFPDVVNCVLGRIGLTPTCGVGNLDELVPMIRLRAARRLQVPPHSLRIFLVAHHALEAAVFDPRRRPLAPYFLRVECQGHDVTGDLVPDRLLMRPFSLPPGRAIHFLTAASALRLMRALASESRPASTLRVPRGCREDIRSWPAAAA